VTFGERIEQPESVLATESSSGWCLSIQTRNLHLPVVRFQHLPWHTALVDRTVAAEHMGYRPEAAERIGFRHSSGFGAVLHTGCRHHLVLRRLPVRHKDWYLEMVGLRHWREGGKTPAAEQKRHYIISMNVWMHIQDAISPVITVLHGQSTLRFRIDGSTYNIGQPVSCHLDRDVLR
jgi:hypothetical protein